MTEKFNMIEVVTGICSVKKMLLKISVNSQKNTCVRVSFLIKLQALDSGTSVVLWIFRDFSEHLSS